MSTPSPQRPNIVIVIMDDLAFGDLACHGNPVVRTPHLDALHTQSTRLTRYCSGPVCTPARASLMTGRYPYRTRAIDTYCGRSMMDPDEITLARLLQNAGYRTGIFGKWHLGDCYPLRACDHGFEEAFVHNGGGLRQPGNPTHYRDGDSYFNPDVLHNGNLVPTTGYCTDLFGQAAIDFIRRPDDRPYFVYYATNAPHVPLEVDPALAQPYLDQGCNENDARIYAMVENIDANVGKLLAAIGDDNTLFIYTSDHGPCGGARYHGQTRFNAGLRDIKGTCYQGGIQVPCFWHWRDHIPAGRDLDVVSNPIDFLPTLCALAGAAPPTDRTIDGRDLTGPLLRGEANPTDTVFVQWHRGDAAVRYRNYAAVTPRYKLTRPHESQPDELYDLQADPGEQHDLAQVLPEVVAMLRAEYDRWFDDVSTTRGPDNFAPPAIHLGTPHENPTYLTRQDWRTPSENGDWSDHIVGHWLVKVTQPGPYAVTLLLPPLEQSAQVHLQCGELRLTCKAEPGQTEVRLTDVMLPTGNQTLHAWYAVGGKELGVRMVTVEQKDSQ